MLLIAVIVTVCVTLAAPKDDGLILNNVYAAGVNLGGKTPEEARQALLEATTDTYTKLDMSVEVHDSVVKLTPDDTGARLDVDAVVEAAYNFGRTGSRSERQQARNQVRNSSYTVSVVPYLNLNTDYIRNAVDALGLQFSSTLSQPSYRVEGERPNLNISTEQIDIDRVYQTLYITLGTAEYGLDTDVLYEQILDAYNANLFQVVGKITVISPESLDLEALYNELCVRPVDAVLDEQTYDVTPEVYGYGFHIDEVRALLDAARNGDEIQVSMGFLRPTVTKTELEQGLFETVLASYGTPASDDANLTANLKLACQALDGFILRADQEFSFNDIVGKPTESKGYKPVTIYVGTNEEEVIGGGISRVASTLFCCALMSDMDILERSGHAYAPGFIEVGLDADIQLGISDLRFQNTTGRPIRIDASVNDAGAVQIQFVGTANDSYTVEIVYETTKTYAPATLTTVILNGNPDGYTDGDVLVQPITGYDVCTYRLYRYANSAGSEPIRELVAFSHYDKRDKVVVQLQEIPSTEEPTAPTEEPTPED